VLPTPGKRFRPDQQQKKVLPTPGKRFRLDLQKKKVLPTPGEIFRPNQPNNKECCQLLAKDFGQINQNIRSITKTIWPHKDLRDSYCKKA
jgi:hypothetical protein